MSYQTDLIERIKDSNKWPSFERPNFLVELNDLADNVLKKNSIEGYLAALLIYHQLCEEMIRLLLDDAHFFIQLSVFPNEIIFARKSRPMFGQILDELKLTVSFDKKELFVTKCDELNKLRIDIVHHITRQSNLKSVKLHLSQVKTLFDEIYQLFDATHDNWQVAFKDLRKDVDWEDFNQ